MKMARRSGDRSVARFKPIFLMSSCAPCHLNVIFSTLLRHVVGRSKKLSCSWMNLVNCTTRATVFGMNVFELSEPSETATVAMRSTVLFSVARSASCACLRQKPASRHSMSQKMSKVRILPCSRRSSSFASFSRTSALP